MNRQKKIIFILGFISLFLIMSTLLFNGVEAEVKLDTVLTTNGLDDDGRPIKFKRVFILNEAPAVQYYAEWNGDNTSHKVLIEWLGPQHQIINQLKLSNFSGDTVKSYISLEKRIEGQIVVPNQPGEYLIKLYIDEELMAVTKFELKED